MRVYVIKNKDNLYATYGRSEFRKELRYARLYKSRATALKYYYNNSNDYKNLKLVEVEIQEVSEEKLEPEMFQEYNLHL